MGAKSGEKKKFFNELEIGGKDENTEQDKRENTEFWSKIGEHNEDTERDG